MLRTAATDEELARLREALAWLAGASPIAFDRLFSPEVAPKSMPMPPDPVANALLAFGLVERGGAGIVGLHRIRRVGERFYFMELGLGPELEYQHELWPETDVLLAALEGAAPGRLCDLACGNGIIGIEAAARGHEVVATDLFETSLRLARFNARLNGVTIDFRQGHLFEPVEGERFDLVLASPHYGGVDDQLRVETLRGAPDHLSDRGRLILATPLEWERTRALGMESVLRPLVEQGLRVTVRPMRSSRRRDWFTVPLPLQPIPNLVSRHRFTLTVERGAEPKLDVEWPTERDVNARPLVPLARLRLPGPDVAVAFPDDILDLAWFSMQMRRAYVRFEIPIPRGLLDACRWGARRCVGERGAAGAIVDTNGGVRPCTHGDLIGNVDDSVATLTQRLQALDEEARAARGCAECPAQPDCSICMFPFPLEATAYCDFMRLHHGTLGDVLRLFSTVERLDRLNVPEGALELRRLPRTEVLPMEGAWLVERGGRSLVFWPLDKEATAGLGELEVDTRLASELRSLTAE